MNVRRANSCSRLTFLQQIVSIRAVISHYNTDIVIGGTDPNIKLKIVGFTRWGIAIENFYLDRNNGNFLNKCFENILLQCQLSFMFQFLVQGVQFDGFLSTMLVVVQLATSSSTQGKPISRHKYIICRVTLSAPKIQNVTESRPHLSPFFSVVLLHSVQDGVIDNSFCGKSMRKPRELRPFWRLLLPYL